MSAFIPVSAAVLLMFLFSPLSLLMAYVLIRPLIQPLSMLHITFLGLPTTTFHALVMVVGAAICVIKTRGRLFVGHITLLYLLLLYSTISFYNTSNIIQGLGGELKLLTGISLFLIAYNGINQREDALNVLEIFSLSAVIPILVGFYQQLSGNFTMFRDVNFPRVCSVFGVANAYGIFLSIVSISTLILILCNRRRRMYMTLMAGILISQILAMNRGTWIAFTLATAVASLFYLRKIKIRWFVIAFAALFILFSGMIVSRFQALEDPSVYGHRYNTFEGRIHYWEQLLPFIARKPFSGHGLASSVDIAQRYFGTKAVPHNDYLRFSLETGIPSAMIYIGFLLMELLRNVFVTRYDSRWKINYPMLILNFYIIIISFTQNIFFNLINFPFFLALIGLSVKVNCLLGNGHYICDNEGSNE